MPNAGTTKRKCIGCPELLGNAKKKCPSCMAIQPYKAKLKAKRTKFNEVKEEWVEKTKKHCNRTRVMDGAHLLVDKLCVLGFYPLLFYGQKVKGRNSYQAHIIIPEKVKEAFCGHAVFTTMKSLYEKLLKVYTETNENVTVSGVEQDPCAAANNLQLSKQELMSSIPAQDEKQHPSDNSDRCRKHVPNNKRKKNQEECTIHLNADTYPYEKIIRRRVREGKKEVLVRWKPCSGCGLAWKDTWEPSDEFGGD
ncbi:hypothetical protein AMEX_G5566 [Astyanax mexicanus]|uniref:Chromo domain-containing protein n=1 Tax=Astyanax mexicanus TaxID=7994 RepID=A0A8T2LK76_ASTMX|nr:hypothetical protein AMEX_G16892 [Astyanax mexicanus]KAG9271247.1 hypothetical protein AMEX_G14142 [Astyanax mexicanus]KAG9271261.1 hypothetical protein AMEX_G14156 [Astyanax mexicanus]KAG9278019.1 hypothetical protein AMEX_G5809 [Astyanax mexicanus]KAG9279693.1 hypothetical protein AMEX_G5238 [Astyanax mexicanus]